MRLLRDTLIGIALLWAVILGGLQVAGGGDNFSPPARIGQSVDVQVTAGETTHIAALFRTADGKTEAVVRAIYAAKPGRYIVYLYPSDGRVDDPAIFVVDATLPK